MTPPLSTGPFIRSTVSDSRPGAPQSGRVSSAIDRIAKDTVSDRKPVRRRNVRRILRSLPARPPGEHATGDVFTGQRERVVIAPIAVDVDVAASQTLIAEAELLHDAQACRVLGADADLHPMQPVIGEA